MSVGFRFRRIARSDEIFGVKKSSAGGSGVGSQMSDQWSVQRVKNISKQA